MDNEHGSLDFAGHVQQGLVHEGHGADDIPTVVRVAAALVVPTGRLVIGVIVLDEPGCIVRKRIHHAAGTLVGTAAIVFSALRGPGLPLGVAGSLIIGAAKVALARHAGHVIHGGCDGCLNAGVKRSCVDGHASPAADADDADAPGICQFVGGKEIHGRQEVLRIDVR